VLNSCIEVSDYNEPYSLCQPLLPSPLSTLGLTRAKPFGIPTPLHFEHHSWLDQEATQDTRHP